MGFPQNEIDFSSNIECPYCKSEDYTIGRHISDYQDGDTLFSDYVGECNDCGRNFKIIMVVVEEEYGSAKLIDGSYNKKPTQRVKVNRNGTASVRSLQEIQSKRSPASKKADARVKAKNTIHTRDYKGNYRPVSLKDGKKWAKNPGSMDIVGVDAPYSKTQQKRNSKGQFISAKKKPTQKRK